MNPTLANVLWIVGALVVLIGAAVAWTMLRRAVEARRSTVASDADRDDADLVRRNAPDAARLEIQKLANESAARSAVDNRPPV